MWVDQSVIVPGDFTKMTVDIPSLLHLFLDGGSVFLGVKGDVEPMPKRQSQRTRPLLRDKDCAALCVRIFFQNYNLPKLKAAVTPPVILLEYRGERGQLPSVTRN